jgi:hypothetical protein
MGKKTTTKRTVMLSGRIQPAISEMADTLSKDLGLTKTAILESAISDYYANYKNGVDVAVMHYDTGGVINLDKIKTTKDETDVLLNIGVGIGTGVVGFKIAKWVRQTYFNADGQDKGEIMDLIGGFAFGILGAVITDHLQRKSK